MKLTKPYGSWKSNVIVERLSEGAVRFGHLLVDSSRVFWLEGLPAEGGRTVIRTRLVPHSCLSETNSAIETLTTANYSVRTRVHEYGGADFSVSGNVLVFSNDDDQCLYRQDLNDSTKIAQQITPSTEFKHQYRYADCVFSKDLNWIICVRETHNKSGDPLKVINEIVKISFTDASKIPNPEVLVSGADFYSYPRISPSGKKLTWTSWMLPNMPWDETQLWLADLNENGVLTDEHVIIDHPNVSITQPSWSPDDVLYFVSDTNDWWNIYRYKNDKIECIVAANVEFGFPQWQFGTTSYNFLSKDTIIAAYVDDGREKLCRIDVAANTMNHIVVPYCSFQGGLFLDSEVLICIAASETLSSSVIAWNMRTTNECRLNSQLPALLQSADISNAEAICFDTTCSDAREHNIAHAFYYTPKNTSYEGPKGEKPPLIVMGHGGPTARTSSEYNTAIQFWTHRGFAVVDVNYRGSTGYGRAYRDALKAQWGILDVDDCVYAAKYLVQRGDVDVHRIAIRGGSAGGYTVYSALINYDFFSAGVSRYGVADLKCLVVESHKFEVRYLDSMIGPWPEAEATYESRSPINNASKMSCPVLLLQGDEDAVVPPAQSIAMAKALDDKSIPYALTLFKGEQHGFRKAENIALALQLELEFYCKIFHIENKIEDNILQLKHTDKL